MQTRCRGALTGSSALVNRGRSVLTKDCRNNQEKTLFCKQNVNNKFILLNLFIFLCVAASLLVIYEGAGAANEGTDCSG